MLNGQRRKTKENGDKGIHMRLCEFVRVSLTIIFVLMVGRAGNAAGVDNSVIGLRGAALGSAFHGISDDASALYYNPAGLSLVEDNQWNAEAYIYVPFTRFEYTVETPMIGNVQPENLRKSENTSSLKTVIPGLFVSKKFRRLALGLGVYVPHGGGGVRYTDFKAGLVEHVGPFTSFITLIAASSGIALEILKGRLSIGATPSVYWGLTKQRFTDPDFGIETVSEHKGFAGVGASLGIMWRPHETFQVGFTVRSPVKAKASGQTRFKGTFGDAVVDIKSDSTLKAVLPLYLALGFGLKPFQRLVIGLSGALIFHGMTDKITTTIQAETEGQDAQVNTFKTHYGQSFRIGLGAEYQLTRLFTARMGFKFDKSPTADAGMSASFNDVNQMTPSLGIAVFVHENLSIDLSGLFVIGFARELKKTQIGGAVQTETFDADHVVLQTGLRFSR